MPIVSPLMLGDNEEFAIARMEISIRAVGAWTSQWLAELSCICKTPGSEQRVLERMVTRSHRDV